MTLVRPEIAAAIRRGRDALTGVALMLVGVWALHGGRGITVWLGGLAVLAGLALLLSGIQRWRFRAGGTGPGVVRVTEGQLTYYGPLDGGTVALDLLERITLDPRGRPMHWVLTHGGGAPLHIPVTAAGAEALFDVFSALPGLRTQAMLAALESPGDMPRVLWSRRATRLRLG